MSKLYKYLYKLNKDTTNNIYANKIALYIQTGGLKESDLPSLLDYLHNIGTKINKTTNNKYLVILYGPPASGKSVARNIACHLIKTLFTEQLLEKDIYNSFIDSNIDDIVNEFIIQDNQKEISVLDKLKEIIPVKDTPENKAKLTFEIYNKIRKSANPLSELLFYFAVFLKKNIFMEISSGDSNYIIKIIEMLKYYNYIPIFIYPYVNSAKILSQRALSRANTNGRYVACKGDYGIAKKIKINLDNYRDIRKYILTMDNFILLQYDASTHNTFMDEFSGFNFTNFDKLSDNLINYIYKIKSEKDYIKHSFLQTVPEIDDKCVE